MKKKEKEFTFRHRLICELPHCFIRFCVENNCLRHYMRETCNIDTATSKNRVLISIKGAKREITAKGCILRILNTSFIWADSKKGFKYWNKIFEKACQIK